MMSLRTYLAREYGGTRPFLVHLKHRGIYALGGYRPDPRILHAPYERVIFVCKGNICRSPYAEARARQMGLNATSAGLDTPGGELASPAAISSAAKRGVDLSKHRTQRLSQLVLRDTDIILVMEPAQVAEVVAATGIPVDRVLLNGALSDPPRPYLQDPYGRSEHYFNRCYELIDAGIARLKTSALTSEEPAQRSLQLPPRSE